MYKHDTKTPLLILCCCTNKEGRGGGQSRDNEEFFCWVPHLEDNKKCRLSLSQHHNDRLQKRSIGIGSKDKRGEKVENAGLKSWLQEICLDMFGIVVASNLSGDYSLCSPPPTEQSFVSEREMALDYKPSEEFLVNSLQPLVDFDVTGSKELWLIQCPMSHIPEIEGKELKVSLGEDGVLGRFEDSSGKEVELVSFVSQEGDASVIIPTENESKIVGKISRRVSLVRFPEPEELLQTFKTQQKSVRAVMSSSLKNSNPALSSRRKSGQSSLRHPASTRSSRDKSLFTGVTETPKSSKRKHSEPSASKHASGSSDKSKKKVKTEK
ncbi:Mediator-associated protein 2 [Hirschfeldia incana]|nr:Mediator-associated protein 2 [Hirschfeldia incana]